MDLKAVPFRSPLSSLTAHVEAVSHEGPVFEFESAVGAVVNGDLAALKAALGRDPALVRARSSRVCCFDPPVHRATLLHYVAANGVEGYRQKTPPNGVEIARALLQAGAEPDALADMYGAACSTMSMLVSSSHPAEAGLQVALVELLLDFGAAIEGRGTKKWAGPLFTALAVGMSDAARLLAKRGMPIDLPAAAELGLVDNAARLSEHRLYRHASVLPDLGTVARRGYVAAAVFQPGYGNSAGPPDYWWTLHAAGRAEGGYRQHDMPVQNTLLWSQRFGKLH